MWVGDTVYFLSDRDGPTTLFAYDTGDEAGPPACSTRRRGHQVGLGLCRRDRLRPVRHAAPVRPEDREVQADCRSASRPTCRASGRRCEKVAKNDPEGRPVADRHAGRVRGPRRDPDRPGREGRRPQPDQHARRRRPRPGVVARRQVDRVLLRRVRRVRAAHPAAGRPRRGEEDQARRRAVVLLQPDRGRRTSKKIAYTDKRLNLWYIDLDTGKSTKVDTDPYDDDLPGSAVWSPDSKWLAYTRQLKNYLSAVFLYSLETGKAHQITDGMSDARYVAFDKSGKYLYFTASTDIGPAVGSGMSTLNRPVTRSAYVVVLSKDDPSPLAPESDDEKAKEADKEKEKEKKGDAKDAPKVKVDIEDLDQRTLALPVPPKNYIGLLAGKAGAIFLARRAGGLSDSNGDGPPARQTVHRFDLSKRKAEKLVDGANSVAVSDNGEKMLYRIKDDWFLVGDRRAGQAGRRGAQARRRGGPGRPAGRVAADVPRGVPHRARLPLRPRLPRVRPEGGVGRSTRVPGRARQPARPELSARRAARRAVAAARLPVRRRRAASRGPQVRAARGRLHGRERPASDQPRSTAGESWNPGLRAPLTQPGAGVKEGEYLLAVDGKAVKRRGRGVPARSRERPASRRCSRSGRSADGKGSREVIVVPVAERAAAAEPGLGRREPPGGGQGDRTGGWRTSTCRTRPREGTRGSTGTSSPRPGGTAVIVDERFNGGGLLADHVIDYLRQPIRNYATTREGADQQFPTSAIPGPKVMLINEQAGSGGDYLPYAFRQAGLGPLIGKRTWGGLVGIGGYPPLVDGGGVTAPRWGIWFPSGKWEVENRGVAPDIEVEFDPKLVREGKDPQLEKAIEIVLDELKKYPVKHPTRPPFPNYYKSGTKDPAEGK